MKFGQPTSIVRKPEEAVAYLDVDGDLRIRQCGSYDLAVGLQQDGISAFLGLDWQPQAHDVQHLFFSGDTLTITF